MDEFGSNQHQDNPNVPDSIFENELYESQDIAVWRSIALWTLFSNLLLTFTFIFLETDGASLWSNYTETAIIDASIAAIGLFSHILSAITIPLGIASSIVWAMIGLEESHRAAHFTMSIHLMAGFIQVALSILIQH